MGYETELKLFIDGAWRQGEGDLSPVINPASGDTIAELHLASTANIDKVRLGRTRRCMRPASPQPNPRDVLVPLGIPIRSTGSWTTG